MSQFEAALLTIILTAVVLHLSNLYVKLISKPKKCDKIEVHHLSNGNTIIICYIERKCKH